MSVLVNVAWEYLDIRTAGLLFGVWWTTQWLMWKGYIFTKGNPAPGIYGIPLFGTVPYFALSRKTTLENIEKYAATYGPVLRLRFGMNTVTLVVGTKAVREGMLSDGLLGRPPQNFGDEELSKAFDFKSIITIEGDLWKKHRRFSLITLRDLGFGKTPIMEDCVQAELRDLIAQVEAKKGEAFDLQDVLVPSTSNNIASLVLGERLPYDHPKRKELNYLLTAFTEETEKLIVVSFIPKLLNILFKLNIGIGSTLKKFIAQFRSIVTEEVEKHRKNIDRDNPRDYVDHYILEQEKDKDFTDDLAGGNAMAFFQAGSATVRVTVEYLLHLMAQMPEVQRRVQAEIDELTGRSREVSWSDNQQLVYTMAVIAERHRYFTVAPFGVQRRALYDTKLCGYDIRAKDIVMFDIDSVHFDPENFSDPYEFQPERFIRDGKLVNTDKVWAFSIGKRACPGESLAVLEVFLYFTNILQNFTVKPEKSEVGVKLRPLRCLNPDVIRQKIRLVKRED